MGITIDGARLWPNATDEEVRGKLAAYPEKILDKNGYLELTFTLQNKDAVTTGSTGHSDHPDWFSSGAFRICDTSGEEIGGGMFISRERPQTPSMGSSPTTTCPRDRWQRIPSAILWKKQPWMMWATSRNT